MRYRDHDGIVIENFMGLYRRGHPDNTPIDHFSDGENFKFTPGGDCETRDGIGISQDVALPLSNVKRIYNYPTTTGNDLIALTYNATTGVGSIYHFVSATVVHGPLLAKTGMIDFAFVPYNGRGYISPIGYFTQGDLNIEKGLQSEFLYVYRGDGTAATKAAGASMTGTMTVANGAAGSTDAGLHIFGFVSETDTGYLSPPGLLTTFTTLGNFSVSFGSVDASPDTHVTKRHLVASKAIIGYNGNTEGYDLFFVPGGTINDNTTNALNNISFFDQDLLDDASHLFDNYTEIPAGAVLSMYHGRLCLATTYTDINLILVSAVGEPEAISQIDGVIEVPPDGNPITNIQELRDVMYVTKRSKTISYVDNGDEPSSWPLVNVDDALGSCIHGIATVLDSGSASIDYLIIATYQGISLFNGRYMSPELSWKIEDLWKEQDRDEFRHIQIIDAPIQKEIYIVMPNRKLLVGNYAIGKDPKSMRWSVWNYQMGVNCIAIYNISEIIIGTDLFST